MTTTRNHHLSPCPVCGAAPYESMCIHIDRDGTESECHWVYCTNPECPCVSQLAPDRETAAALWNAGPVLTDGDAE